MRTLTARAPQTPVRVLFFIIFSSPNEVSATICTFLVDRHGTRVLRRMKIGRKDGQAIAKPQGPPSQP